MHKLYPISDQIGRKTTPFGAAQILHIAFISECPLWESGSCWWWLTSDCFVFIFQLVDFLLFSVISLLLSALLIVCYSMAVITAFTGEEMGTFSWYSYGSFNNQNMLRTKIFTLLVLILGCLEFLLCVGSIGYFAYSYKRDYGKVSISFQICAKKSS